MSSCSFGAILASLAAKGVIIVGNANCCDQESGMKPVLIFAQVLSAISICQAQALTPQARGEAEYYVAAYAQYYRVPGLI
jgi:hypothetical protein